MTLLPPHRRWFLSLLSAALIFGGSAPPARAATAQITNGILSVTYQTSGPEVGQFTVATGANAPAPNQPVFYNGTTSYITLRDVTSKIMWFNTSGLPAPGLAGYTAKSMVSLASAPVQSGAGYSVTYTLPDCQVVQQVTIGGTTVANSRVLQQVTVRNTSAVPHQFGARYLWDWRIGANDSPFFTPQAPNGATTSTFTTFSNPAFAAYQQADKATAPTYSIYGSVQSSFVTPAATEPDQVRYAGFNNSFSSAWDFANSGTDSDSTVTYFWGYNTPITIAAGGSSSFSEYVATSLQAIAPPSLSISAAASAATANAGSQLTYTLTYGNTGRSAAAGATITAAVPTGSTFVSATNGGTLSGGTVTFPVGNIAAAATGRVTFTVQVTAGTGTLTESTYSISATNAATVAGAAVHTGLTGPHLSVAETGSATVNAGGTIAYTFTYANSGTGAATGVTITDQLPAGTTLASASAPFSVANNIVTFSAGNVAAGASGLTKTLTVNVTAFTGSVANTKFAIQATNEAAVAGTGGITTTIVPAALTIVKSAPATVNPSSQLQYTFTYGNSGRAPAQGVTVTDQIPDGTTFATSDNSHFTTATNGQGKKVVTWTIGALAASSTGNVFHFTVNVPSTVNPTTVTNSIYGIQATNASPLAGATAIKTTVNVPALTTFNLAEALEANHEIQYTLTYFNGGTAAITNAVFTDALPTNSTLISSTPATTSLASGTATWNLGTINANSGGTIVFVLQYSAQASQITNTTYSLTGNNIPAATGPPVVATISGSPGGPVAAVELAAAGGSHSLFVQSGSVFAWGYNGASQLGDGTTTNRTLPVLVHSVSGTLTGATGVAAGWYHSLAILSNGTVVAWGLNSSGQVGDTSTVNRTTAVPVAGLSNILAVSAGVYHSLALDSSGRVWAWGSNFYGQLGNGEADSDAHATPELVQGLLGAGERAIAISAGAGHSVAVVREPDGSTVVRAWGWNAYGQLGNGTTVDSAVPVTVQMKTGGNLLGIALVAAGYAHNLALNGSGQVFAWGNNSYGQLANPATNGTDQTAAIQVVTAPGVGAPPLNNAIGIAAGAGHSLALLSGGAVMAWGLNSYGQLGTGVTAIRSVPTAVRTPTTAGWGSIQANISAGYAHSLVIVAATKHPWDWGYGSFGQLGDNSIANSEIPVPVGTLVQSVAAVFSAGTADAAAGTVTIHFVTALSNSANNATNYSVTSNGLPIAVQAASYSSGTVTLSLPRGALPPGATVAVQWRGLTSSGGAALAAGSLQLLAH